MISYEKFVMTPRGGTMEFRQGSKLVVYEPQRGRWFTKPPDDILEFLRNNFAERLAAWDKKYGVGPNASTP